MNFGKMVDHKEYHMKKMPESAKPYHFITLPPCNY